MSDVDAEAWRIVRELRNEFIGRTRRPADEDWAEFIARGISRLETKPSASVKTDDYDAGYQDALDDMESAVYAEKNRRTRDRASRRAAQRSDMVIRKTVPS